MRPVNPRWDAANRRWEASIGSGKTRKWFRCKIEGETGRAVVVQKVEKYLHGPAPLRPGSLAEFVESVWWPRVKAGCTPATIKGYRFALKGHVSKFYSWQLADIRLEALQPWVSSMGLSPKRVRNVFGVMAGILELAHKMGRYPHRDHKLVVLPEVVRERKAGLELANVEKLLAVAKGTPMEGPIWAAAFLGLRRNEVCGLKKGHVEKGKITVRHNRQTHGETEKLKSKPLGAERVLNVPDWMSDRMAAFGAHDGIYLFHDGKGRPIHPDAISKAMPALCTAAGIPALRFHDLRAAARSNLSALGVPDLVLMDILGHSSIETSLIYQDARAERMVEAFDRLRAHLSKG